MERWARNEEFKHKVVFLCLSVAGPELANVFSTRYKLQGTVNGFIEREQDMPRFGQLGCRGFVIFDSSGNVVIPASESFLDIEDKAFRDVEFQLQSMLNKGEGKRMLPDGQRVQLARLVRARTLNRAIGTVVGFDSKNNRYRVKVDGHGKDHGIMSTNLFPIEGGKNKRRKTTTTCEGGSCGKSFAGNSTDKPTKADTTNCLGVGCREENTNKVRKTDSDTKRAPECSETTLLSVGVPSLDREHKDCMEAIGAMENSPSLKTLKQAREVVQSHFDHEENMFKDTGFDDGGKFSKATSHILDHKKMLNEIDAEIKRCESSMKLLKDGTTAEPLPSVCKTFASAFAKRLAKHTNQYDSQYAPYMSKNAQA